MTAVLTFMAVVVALACPAHMLWRTRRGHGAACAPSRRRVEELGDRQARLAEDVARLARDRS
jgi:hypothetical protein